MSLYLWPDPSCTVNERGKNIASLATLADLFPRIPGKHNNMTVFQHNTTAKRLNNTALVRLNTPVVAKCNRLVDEDDQDEDQCPIRIYPFRFSLTNAVLLTNQPDQPGASSAPTKRSKTFFSNRNGGSLNTLLCTQAHWIFLPQYKSKIFAS